MSEMNVEQVLAQMRALSVQASGKAENVETRNEFASLLQQSIDGVNTNQQKSAQLAKAFELGDKNVSLAEVMIASQKANVSFQAMVQVRNKLVEAYQDIMNMPT